MHGDNRKALFALLHPSLAEFPPQLHELRLQLDSVPLSRMVGASGSFLGGDPAAGSPAATLLRLLPPCQTWVRYRQ